MKFADKYTKDKTKEPEKEQVSVEAYAICELLQAVTDEFVKWRINR